MKLVLSLTNDAGTVTQQKVERSIPADQLARVLTALRLYFGNPTVEVPPANQGDPSTRRAMTDAEIFNLWGTQVFDRLREQTKKSEARTTPPANGGLLD